MKFIHVKFLPNKSNHHFFVYSNTVHVENYKLFYLLLEMNENNIILQNIAIDDFKYEHMIKYKKIVFDSKKQIRFFTHNWDLYKLK